MGFGDAVAGGEAQACAGAVAVTVEAYQWLQDFCPVFGNDALAVVRNKYSKAVVVGVATDANL